MPRSITIKKSNIINIALMLFVVSGCKTVARPPCPSDKAPRKNTLSEQPVTYHTLLINTASFSSFSQAADKPLAQIQQALGQLSYDGKALKKVSAPVSLQQLSSKTEHVQYLLTDLSDQNNAYIKSIPAFIQRGGAVGVVSFLSDYQGQVSASTGSYYHTGPRRLYLLVAGAYDAVQRTLNILRTHPQSQSYLKAQEFTVFVNTQIQKPSSFLTEDELMQFKATLNNPSIYPILTTLKAGLASQEAKRNRELNQQVGEPIHYATFAGHDLRRANHFKAECRPEKSLQIRIKNNVDTLKFREVFLTYPYRFAPQPTKMYAETKMRVFKPGERKWQNFDPSQALNTVTYKAFDGLWSQPQTSAADLATGSPFETTLPLGAFSWELKNLKSLRSDIPYAVNITLYPSKTGQDIREKASEFYRTALPINEYDLDLNETKACQSGQAKNNVCGATPGFSVIYEDWLKASIPFHEKAENRQVIAE
jgi:hypothetical protein